MIGGKKNPLRAQVALEIRGALLKKPATMEGPAQYWSKEEQKENLYTVYTKYSKLGGVWSAAAQAVSHLISEFSDLTLMPNAGPC